MQNFISPLAEGCAAVIELIGTGIITLVALYAVGHAAARLLRKEPPDNVFQDVRQRLGQGILLGLEFLVAADIIHTVAVDLSLATLGLLSVVLLIRTFLSFTLEVELSGRWPWQARKP